MSAILGHVTPREVDKTSQTSEAAESKPAVVLSNPPEPPLVVSSEDPEKDEKGGEENGDGGDSKDAVMDGKVKEEKKRIAMTDGVEAAAENGLHSLVTELNQLL